MTPCLLDNKIGTAVPLFSIFESGKTYHVFPMLGVSIYFGDGWCDGFEIGMIFAIEVANSCGHDLIQPTCLVIGFCKCNNVNAVLQEYGKRNRALSMLEETKVVLLDELPAGLAAM
jgi:hypothetical protein